MQRGRAIRHLPLQLGFSHTIGDVEQHGIDIKRRVGDGIGERGRVIHGAEKQWRQLRLKEGYKICCKIKKRNQISWALDDNEKHQRVPT